MVFLALSAVTDRNTSNKLGFFPEMIKRGSTQCSLLFVVCFFCFFFFCHVPPQLVSDSLLEQERGGKRSRFLLPVISTAETWQSEAAQPKGRDESWILHGYTEKSVNDKKRIHDLIPLAPSEVSEKGGSKNDHQPRPSEASWRDAVYV